MNWRIEHMKKPKQISPRFFAFCLVAMLLLTGLSVLPGRSGGNDEVPRESLFFEDWESGTIDTEIWKKVGSPDPIISTPGYNGSLYSLDTNGDGNYNSDVVTYEEFPLDWLYLSFFGKFDRLASASAWNIFSARISNKSAADISDGNHETLVRISVDYCDTSGKRGAVVYDVKGEIHKEGEYFVDIAWHYYAMNVNSNGTVSFYVDEELRWTSAETVDTSVSKPIMMSGRSAHEPHYIDNISVSRPVPPKLALSSEQASYRQGDLVTINAAYSNGTASVTFQVKDHENTTYIVKTHETDEDGLVQFSFRLGDDVVVGNWSVTATNDRDEATNTTAFDVLPAEILHLILKAFDVPASVNKGSSLQVEFTIENTFDTGKTITLVLQLEDPEMIPIQPGIQVQTVFAKDSPSFILAVAIPSDASTGTYAVQGQVLTELPENGGYAWDYEDATTVVT